QYIFDTSVRGFVHDNLGGLHLPHLDVIRVLFFVAGNRDTEFRERVDVSTQASLAEVAPARRRYVERFHAMREWCDEKRNRASAARRLVIYVCHVEGRRRRNAHVAAFIPRDFHADGFHYFDESFYLFDAGHALEHRFPAV